MVHDKITLSFPLECPLHFADVETRKWLFPLLMTTKTKYLVNWDLVWIFWVWLNIKWMILIWRITLHMMFPPSDDGGENLETLSNIIQKYLNQLMVRSKNSLFSKTSGVLKGYWKLNTMTFITPSYNRFLIKGIAVTIQIHLDVRMAKAKC